MPAQLEGLDGLIIPGGESTTIGKLATEFGLIEPLRDFAQSKPTWGTCAGMIFLARDIGIDRQPILGVMNIKVNRNAFGRQIDSFEADLHIKPLGDPPFHAVFIRAPVVTEAARAWMCWRSLTTGGSSRCSRDHLLATAFHPELTGDSRLHRTLSI